MSNEDEIQRLLKENEMLAKRGARAQIDLEKIRNARFGDETRVKQLEASRERSEQDKLSAYAEVRILEQKLRAAEYEAERWSKRVKVLEARAAEATRILAGRKKKPKA